jgi:HAD superfamily hydrolase (TIGR01509 family)
LDHQSSLNHPALNINSSNHFIVIFDMDGVILDSERVYQSIERAMYRELGIPVSPAEHRNFMGTAERLMWSEIRKKYSVVRPLDELVMEERMRFLSELKKPGGIPLMDGLIPLLRSLQSEQIPCWIASSSSSEIIGQVLQKYELDDLFRGYISGDEVPRSKPSPDIFLKAASRAETSPADCIVIEDSENGVRAALDAGMKVIGLVSGKDPDHFFGGPEPDLSAAQMLVSGLTELNPGRIRKLVQKV